MSLGTKTAVLEGGPSSRSETQTPISEKSTSSTDGLREVQPSIVENVHCVTGRCGFDDRQCGLLRTCTVTRFGSRKGSEFECCWAMPLVLGREKPTLAHVETTVSMLGVETTGTSR